LKKLSFRLQTMTFYALLASTAFGFGNFGQCMERNNCLTECEKTASRYSCLKNTCPMSLCARSTEARGASNCWDYDGDEATCRSKGCVVEKSFMNHVGEVVYCFPPRGRGIRAEARGHGAGSVRCDLEKTCGDCKKDRSHGHCAWVKTDGVCMTTGEAMMSGKYTLADLAISASQCSARGLQEMIAPTMRGFNFDDCWLYDEDLDTCTKLGCRIEKIFDRGAPGFEAKYCEPPLGRGIREARRTSNWCAKRCDDDDNTSTSGPFGCDCSECAAGGRQNNAGRCGRSVDLGARAPPGCDPFRGVDSEECRRSAASKDLGARAPAFIFDDCARFLDSGARTPAFDDCARSARLGGSDTAALKARVARGLDGYEEDRSFGYKMTGCRSQMGGMYSSIMTAKAECDNDPACGAIVKPFGGGYKLCNGSDIVEQGGARVMVKIAAPSDAGNADDCGMIKELGMCDMKINFGACVGDLEMGSACCAASCA